MKYFKVFIEEGRKKRTERKVVMQGNDICETVYGNLPRFNRAKLLAAFPISREEFLREVAAKE